MARGRIAVIGVGNIGATVCADLLLWGYEVVAVDRSQARLDEAHAEIERAVRFAPMLRKQLARVTANEIAQRLELSTDLVAIRGAKIVIENVPEQWETKEALYPLLDDASDEGSILAANTSCISITRLANLIRDPSRVVGMHFMNPAYLSEAVEVVRGFHTSPTHLEDARTFIGTLGKEAVVVEDLPGFASNRVSHLFMNEAAWGVHEGVATVEAMDRVFKKGFGHRMGPLETADLIGIDTVVNTLDELADAYRDPKFRCCPLLRKMVDARLLGRKTGRGFYEYPTK